MSTLSTFPAASVAFSTGRNDGRAARLDDRKLSAYLRIGLDDYAKGYREGFFSRKTPACISAPAQDATRHDIVGWTGLTVVRMYRDHYCSYELVVSSEQVADLHGVGGSKHVASFLIYRDGVSIYCGSVAETFATALAAEVAAIESARSWIKENGAPRTP